MLNEHEGGYKKYLIFFPIKQFTTQSFANWAMNFFIKWLGKGLDTSIHCPTVMQNSTFPWTIRHLTQSQKCHKLTCKFVEFISPAEYWLLLTQQLKT
jgi:hypothetical protein